MRKPRVALTAGDPAGIGPEIVAKAIADPRVLDACEPIVYGSAADVPMGRVSATAGLAAYEALLRAVADAQAGRVDAVTTAPINKAAFAEAGLPWKGHTDLLAEITGSASVAMMFWSAALKVVLATVHEPLSSVPRLLTRERLDGVVALTARALPAFGIARPRLALCGLNPHAGEDGVIGDEELRILRPAVEAARAAGVDLQGPFPADTLFVRAQRGEFDAVIACYHDQGLIPVKLVSFGTAVNVTLGLPIIRTSVDHGTAFDIAGRGVADPGSLVEATLLAARLARVRIAAGPAVSPLGTGS